MFNRVLATSARQASPLLGGFRTSTIGCYRMSTSVTGDALATTTTDSEITGNVASKTVVKAIPREERRSVEVSSKNMRVSPQKLNVLAKLVRKMNVVDAVDNLRFSNKRISAEFLELLNGGVLKAKKEFNLEPHELVLAEAYVGKGLTKKTMDIKGRGRTGIERSRRSHLTLVVRESRRAATQKVEVPTGN